MNQGLHGRIFWYVLLTAFFCSITCGPLLGGLAKLISRFCRHAIQTLWLERWSKVCRFHKSPDFSLFLGWSEQRTFLPPKCVMTWSNNKMIKMFSSCMHLSHVTRIQRLPCGVKCFFLPLDLEFSLIKLNFYVSPQIKIQRKHFRPYIYLNKTFSLFWHGDQSLSKYNRWIGTYFVVYRCLRSDVV